MWFVFGVEWWWEWERSDCGMFLWFFVVIRMYCWWDFGSREVFGSSEYMDWDCVCREVGCGGDVMLCCICSYYNG